MPYMCEKLFNKMPFNCSSNQSQHGIQFSVRIVLAKVQDKVSVEGKFTGFALIYVLKSNFNFQGHQKVHQQTPEFFCEVCNKGFRRFSSRTKHMVIHSDERPFSCQDSTCKKTFKRKGDAQIHFNEFHLRKWRFACTVCDARFFATKLRAEHMKQLHPAEYLEYQEKHKFNKEANRLLYQKDDKL